MSTPFDEPFPDPGAGAAIRGNHPANTPFDQAFQDVVGLEGGFDLDPHDTGNWTGGRIGYGRLAGTKFGISAAAYPSQDIQNLTLDQAKAIYRRDYWGLIHGEELHPGLALVVFDNAVNSGVPGATRTLQEVVGARVDGVFGPATLAAVNAATASRGVPELVVELLAARAFFDASLNAWPRYGRGWARRLFTIALEELEMPVSLTHQG